MNPLSVLSGIWGYVGAAALSAALAAYGSYWVTSRGYQTEISHIQAQQAQATSASVLASMKQLQGFIATMNLATSSYQVSDSRLQTQLETLHNDFLKASAAKPLPADCRPDASRLSILTAAVAAANQAAGAEPSAGTTVRNSPASGSP